MEDLFFPTVDGILDAVSEALVPLPGRPPSPFWSPEEMLRRARLGV
jgi:hypothetical protein